VAEDEVGPESAGLGWSQLLQGHLTVQKVPGSHRTIFSSPNVSVLAGELAKRLEWSQPAQNQVASRWRNETRLPMIHPELGFHRG
jgi:hypothetical protein